MFLSKLILIYICIRLDSNVNLTPEDEFNEKFTDSQHISLKHVNIRSSKKNLRDFMRSINNLNIKFSFIVLSEIWGDSNDAMLNFIP